MKCNLCGSSDSTVILDGQRSYYRIVRCTTCRLVFADPPPGPEEVGHLYEGNYTYFTPRYEVFYKSRDYKKAVALLDEMENYCAPGRLLDAGCATGTLLVASKEKGWEPEGIEISSEASNIARARGCTVHSGALDTVSLIADRYDAVTLMDSLEHMYDPLGSLRRVFQAVKPGGVLALETPNFDSIYRKIIGRRWTGFNPFHLYFFTPGSIQRMLDAAGFSILRLMTTNADLISRDALFRWGIRDAIAEILKERAKIVENVHTASLKENATLDAVERVMNLPFAVAVNACKRGDQIRLYARKDL